MEEKTFKRKRKRPKSHLKDAKFYAQRGVFGRGSEIDEDQYTYFLNILEAIENGFETLEDKAIMANNVFEQTTNQEVHLSSNQIVSRTLEGLIGFVSPEILERFFTAFAKDFRPICSHSFASYVLEKMIEIAFLRTIGHLCKEKEPAKEAATKETKNKGELDNVAEMEYNTRTDFSDIHRVNCSDFVKRVGKFLLNNLEDFVWDPCANHIMRTCVLLLGGVYVPKVAFDKSKNNSRKSSKIFKVPSDWLDIMSEFPKRLQLWPQFPDLAYQPHPSPLLGSICLSLQNCDKKQLKHFGSKILKESFVTIDETIEPETKKKLTNGNNPFAEENTVLDDGEKGQESVRKLLPKVFKFQCSVILLETLISVAGPKLLTQIYVMLFAGRAPALAKDELANNCLEKLLQHIQEKDEFESIFVELTDELEEILKIDNTRVVAALAGACLRLQSKQSPLIMSLQKALHTTGDKQKVTAFFQCLVKLVPYEIVFEQQKPDVDDDNKQQHNSVHLHGSLIVQHILNFAKPIILVTSILETPPDILEGIFKTPPGSFIVNAFMYSPSVGEKSREKLARLMDGFYVDLAITKFGSRVVDVIIETGSKQLKTRILKELSERVNLLNSSPFGRLLHQKFRIGTV